MSAEALPYFGGAEMDHLSTLTLQLRRAREAARAVPTRHREAHVERRRVLLHEYLCRVTGVWL